MIQVNCKRDDEVMDFDSFANVKRLVGQGFPGAHFPLPCLGAPWPSWTVGLPVPSQAYTILWCLLMSTAAYSPAYCEVHPVALLELSKRF